MQGHPAPWLARYAPPAPAGQVAPPTAARPGVSPWLVGAAALAGLVLLVVAASAPADAPRRRRAR